jgi:hypothetical protein
MHTSISALDIYPNVRTLLGMIVGLALAHMLTQFARIIEYNRWRKLYWPHMVRAAFMLVYIIHFWWWQVRLSMLPNWTFGEFAFIVFYALLVFLACTVVLPGSLIDGRGEDDQSHYYARRGWFFGLVAAIYVVDIFDSLLKGSTFVTSLGIEYFLRNGTYVLLALIATRTRSERYHQVFAVLAFAYQVAWIVRRYEVFG